MLFGIFSRYTLTLLSKENSKDAELPVLEQKAVQEENQKGHTIFALAFENFF